PKRGHGTPQPRYALEVQLDKLAEQLGTDPADLRLKHLVPANSLTANYLRVGSMGLGACLEKVVAGSEWKRKFRKLPPGKGVGLACSSYICGAGLPIYWNNMPHSGVQLKCDRGGGVTVFCGSTEIGQGSDSILAYIVAEVLGLDPFDIAVVTADTDLTPVDLGSYSSRVTLMTGNAAIQAAERAREILAGHAALKLQIPAARVVFADGRVFDAEDPRHGMAFAEAVQVAEAAQGTIGTVGSYTPPRSAAKYRGGGVGPSPAYSYSAAVAEVDVDPDTGVVTVPRIWIAHDIGQSINAAAVMGQVEGSVYMGLGEALMEEMAYRGNRNVVHKIPSLLEYKSPTTLEMCDVVTYLIEDPDPSGPFGAKEVGQGPLLPVPPAIANAVYDAVGVRVDEVPITPEKVLKALKKKGKGEEGRVGPTSFPDILWREGMRDGGCVTGSCVTLTELSQSRTVRQSCAAVATAGEVVSTPLLRNMGTLGGNLCLDTRCNYYNQSYEWRKAIDFCMKKDGAICWVAPSSPRCWAVSSSDVAPVMVAVGADYVLVEIGRAHVVPAARFYHNDGINYLTKQPDEVLAAVRVPAPDGWDAVYHKLRRRGSFDFPVLGVAAWTRWEQGAGSGKRGRVMEARIVLGGVASWPQEVPEAGAVLVGTDLSDEGVAAAADAAYRPAKPLDNTDFDLSW